MTANVNPLIGNWPLANYLVKI